MHRRKRLLFAGAFLIASLLAFAVTAPEQQAVGAEQSRSVPKASCGAHDRIESVQGQTTLAERYSSASHKGYQCNLELLGQVRGEGSDFGMITYQDCAYYSTWPNPQR